MDDSAIPRTEDQLLGILQNSDNPTDLLGNLFDIANQKEDLRLRHFLKSLSNRGYLHIPIWADDKPYHVELLEPIVHSQYEHSTITINDNHSIIIGDGAKVARSIIGGAQKNVDAEAKGTPLSFFGRHPIACSLAISFFIGFALLFSFWKNIVNAIEGLL